MRFRNRPIALCTCGVEDGLGGFLPLVHKRSRVVTRGVILLPLGGL